MNGLIKIVYFVLEANIAEGRVQANSSERGRPSIVGAKCWKTWRIYNFYSAAITNYLQWGGKHWHILGSQWSPIRELSKACTPTQYIRLQYQCIPKLDTMVKPGSNQCGLTQQVFWLIPFFFSKIRLFYYRHLNILRGFCRVTALNKH